VEGRQSAGAICTGHGGGSPWPQLGRPSCGPLVCYFVMVAALLAGLLPSLNPSVAGATTATWSQYLFDGGHSSYNSGATAIAASNVSTLNPLWRWKDPAPTHGGSNTLTASPTVVSGVVYIGDEDGRFWAIQEATQVALWSQYIGVVLKTTCGTRGIISTASVVTDPGSGKLAVYVNAPDGYLYAFDAGTGNLLWRSQLDVPSTTVNNYYAWGSPLVVNGTVYIGIASMCDNPLVPAGLMAFSQSTGKEIGFWHSLPNTESGASIWSSPAVLPDGSVIVTTGNGKQAWGSSIVRLNGTTLAFEDGWRIPSTQQISDSDFGGSPTLFMADLSGVETPMVGACNKNGIYYVFKQSQLNVGPVWKYQLAAPASKSGQCDAAAIWDGTRLIAGGGNTTMINGVTYDGSVQSLNPTTGAPIWQTGLPGSVIGSPTEDGSGLIAAPVYRSSTGQYGVYLLQASDGALVGSIPTANGVFSQPVFANSDLLVAAQHELTAYGITAAQKPAKPAPPTASAGNASATVSWTAAKTNGSPIIRYKVVSSSGQSCTWRSGPLTCTVKNLTNGTSYTFKVKAKNSVGWGPASTPSNAVVPS